MDLSDLRISYTKDSFSESDLLESPFDQFEKWFSEALKSKVDEPNAMSLATISPEGNPRTRIVLVKDFSKDGLIFYTNYESAKARGMKVNKAVSVNFVWHPLQRQINIRCRSFSSSLGTWWNYFEGWLDRPSRHHCCLPYAMISYIHHI